MIKDVLRSIIGGGGPYIKSLMRQIDSSLTVFVLHDVTDSPATFTESNDISVTIDLFRMQMNFIAEHFNIISMGDVLKGNIPNRAAVITFDDGYKGTFDNALPILEGMKVPFTVFLNMSPINGGNFWAEKIYYLCQFEPQFTDFLISRGIAITSHTQLECTQELLDEYEQNYGTSYLEHLENYASPYVSNETLTQLGDCPYLTLGSHLYTHYNVRNLTGHVLDDQYHQNAVLLSKFDNYQPVFAFPFGVPGLCFSNRQVNDLMRSGATKLFTTWPQPNMDKTTHVLDRISLTPWHNCPTRLWFQILRYPLCEMLGVSGRKIVYTSDGLGD